MKFINNLKEESSPYLLQHAGNPVNWYPWCEAAFEKAVREEKPIFLSIGYSTCHWCHVMARESFENEELARALNKDFISIKVDREERPDIDNIYMRVCQMITGSGGWPLTIFMTPHQLPFFAGTYFPPDAFARLMKALSSAWHHDRQKLLKTAREISAALEDRGQMRTHQSVRQDSSPKIREDRLLQESLSFFRQTFDAVNGGFGPAPKFPSPHNLMLLLAHAPGMAEKTLIQMYKGGIFDHIGGGFSRYSTDLRWLAPHFEKMLYDNALLAMAYTLSFARSQDNLYRHVAGRIFSWLRQEMASPEGGFYAAQDADTEGEEGKYYLFTPREIQDILGKKQAFEFCKRYDISESGNFEGKNIPNLLSASADIYGTNIQLEKLYRYRSARFALHTDKKQLTGWNCLTAAAFAFAGRIFADEELTAAAKSVLDFIDVKLYADGVLFSGYTAGKRSGPGFLDDYAFYIMALIQMYKTSGKPEYLIRGFETAERVIRDFLDEKGHGFFFSGAKNETLITSVKECYDGAIPSGNSVMAYDLVQLIALAEYDAPPEIRRRLPLLKDTLTKHRAYMDDQASSHPAGHSFYLFSLFPPKKIDCRDDMCRPTDEDIF